MHKINKIYWERVNLHLCFSKKVNVNKAYLVSDNIKIEIPINNNELIINVTNTPEGEMLDKGNWLIVVEDERVILEKDLLNILEDKSRIFNYQNNKYAYLVHLKANEDMSLVININFMLENKKYKKKYSFSNEKGINKIKVLFVLLFLLFINIFYYFVRLISFNKNKKVVFITENGTDLSGNLEKLYNSIDENKWKKKKIAIDAFDKNNQSKFRKVINYFKEIIVAGSANNIIIDNYTLVFTYLNLSRNVKLIQVWHAGVGFKSVGYARFGLDGSPHPYISSHRKYTYVIVDQDSLIPIYKEVFGTPSSIFRSYGMPRLDNYLDMSMITDSVDELENINPLITKKKIILFSPTYRGNGNTDAFYDYSLINLSKIYNFCKKNGFIFIIKMHPFIKEKIKIDSKYSDLIFDYSNLDINKLIYVSDIMITDYSSCAYEFSLFNRPLIFYRFDKELYEYLRPMHTVDLFTSKQYEVRDFVSLLEVLETLKNIDINKRFCNIDNNSRKNVCKKIIELLGDNNENNNR